MKLSVKAMAVAAGLLWGGALLLCGLAHLMWPAYAAAFLNGIASVYPGYAGGSSGVDVLIGTLYGLADGAIAGAIFAWLYNRIAR